MPSMFNTLFEDTSVLPHKIGAVYISCYFGNGRIKQSDWDILLKQLTKFSDLDIYIVDMDFDDSMRSEISALNNSVHFIHNGGKIDTPQSRNLCFDHLYDSDYDFAFVCDNNAWIDNNEFDGATIIDQWNRHEFSNDFEWIDIWAPVWGEYVLGAYEESEHFNEYFSFKREVRLKGSVRCIRNMNKHYGSSHKLYNHPSIHCNEDYAFNIMAAERGRGVYMMDNCVLYEEGVSGKQLIEQSLGNIAKCTDRDLVEHLDIHSLRLTSGGTIDYNEFYKNKYSVMQFKVRKDRN